MEAKHESHLTKSVFITNVTKHKNGTLTAYLQLVIYSRGKQGDGERPSTVVTINSPTLTGFQEVGAKTALEVAAEKYGSRGTIERVVSWLKDDGGGVFLYQLYADMVVNGVGGHEKLKDFYYEVNRVLIDALELLP